MLKKAILNYKTRQALKKRGHQNVVDFRNSQRIAIICSDLFENEENVSQIIKDMRGLGKDVNLMVFCHQPKKKITELPFFTSLDVSVGGTINSEELNTFLNQPYDFALCFDQSGHFLIDYVFSLIKTRCRVGVSNDTKYHHYELMIQKGQENTPLSSEVLRYLKMIQNHEYQPV
ncbi:MAG: hypothetical protein RIC35_07375 [Marinoscillum sp.]